MDLTQFIPALASLGVGGAIAIVLIFKTIPAMTQAFREEMQAERASCDQRWLSFSERSDRHHAEVMAALRPVPYPPPVSVSTASTVPNILRQSQPANAER